MNTQNRSLDQRAKALDSSTAVQPISPPANARTEALDVSINDVKVSYRRWAGVYDAVFGAVLEDGRRKLLAHVATLKPARLLEMGVGTGLLLPKYPTETEVVGVDISDDMLALARQKIAKHNLQRTSVQLDDCERLSFADASFDCVVLPYILSVTPRPRALIDEAIRVCKPNGHIIIANHFSGSKTWAALEKIAAPVAAKIGFRSSFSYDEHILQTPLKVTSLERANILGLSKVVVARPS